MNPIDDSRPTDAWIDERLEAFLDEELPADERETMDHALAAEATWQFQIVLADRIKTALRTTETPSVPAGLTRAILARTRRVRRAEIWRNSLPSFLTRLRAAWQPALALTSVAALATFLFSAGGFDASQTAAPPEPGIEQALAEVKWTLGYISKTGRKTGESVQSAIGPLLQGSAHE